MWNAVVIGEGNAGNTAIIAFSFEDGCSISENSSSYWISNVILEMGMTIMKSTVQGKRIAKFLTAHKNGLTGLRSRSKQLKESLECELLKRAPYKTLKTAIQNSVDDAYTKGRQEKGREILRLLEE